jgi:hypothetical protein
MAAMIPSDKSAAVVNILQQTFGVSEPDTIEPIEAGPSSDRLFRITVSKEAFLLLIMTSVNEINDPIRRFTCVRIAADACVAPPVRYLGFNDGISVTDFINSKPLSVAYARLAVPGTLAKVHSLKPFPKEFNFKTAAQSLHRFRSSALLPQTRVDKVFTQYARIANIYPRLEEDMVSSHGDLRRENVVFDGERIWLLDWKAAFVNDRYFDLAVAANYLVTNAEEEAAFLGAYFGRSASEYESSRFFLMRQIVNMMAACIYILIGNGATPVELDEQRAAAFEDVHRRLWTGDLHLAEQGSRLSYGLTHWNWLEENLNSSRFEDALRMVAALTPRTRNNLLPTTGD